MTNERAKLLLQAYRPGGQDARDPLYAEVLKQVRRDPELARWFEAEQSLDSAIGEKLREPSLPPTLKPNILALEMTIRPTLWWQRRSWMATAALGLGLAIAAFWLPARNQSRFVAYRDSMTDFLNTRFDHLDFKASDVTQLQQFLAQHGALGNFVLPAGMSELPSHGCRVLEWNGRKVSLICFHLGGNKEIHLFIIQGTNFADAPPPGALLFASSRGWFTASWQQGKTTYLLAGNGDRAFLQRYL